MLIHIFKIWTNFSKNYLIKRVFKRKTSALIRYIDWINQNTTFQMLTK